jgi:antitoxin VapB
MYIRGLTRCAADGTFEHSAFHFFERQETPMPRTRVFKSGNSQAVRIPSELAYADMDIDLEITRLGDVITIVPARNSLSDAVASLRRMPKPPAVEEREPFEVPTRQRD